MENPKNKTIQLCGIGNGLVDMQFRVTDALLEQLPNIEKSEMRLLDELEQISTISLLKNIVPNRCSGGSATNTLYAFAQFGGKGAYLTSVGDDGNGKYYYDELNNVGIKYKTNTIADKKTGTCLVLITPDGERTMLTCLAASQDFDVNHIDEELIATSEWLYIEGYKLSEIAGVESILKAIEIAKNNDTKIALTASDVFIVNYCNDDFMKVLSKSDLIFCNESEAKAIANTKDSDFAFDKLKQLCSNVVMTKGKQGSIVFIENKKYEFSAVPTEMLDATGAGDMYAGAFLFGMLNFEGEDRIERTGKLASYSASVIVSQLGARYMGDIQKLINPNNNPSPKRFR
jgi:sugar/nucleoside kinase (ribokinase family)